MHLWDVEMSHFSAAKRKQIHNLTPYFGTLHKQKKKKKVPSSTQGKRQETTQFIMLQEGCCRPLLPVNELSTLKSFNAEATSWIAHLIQLGTQFTSFAIVVGISF